MSEDRSPVSAPQETFALSRRGLPLTQATRTLPRSPWLPSVVRSRAQAVRPLAASQAPTEQEDEAMPWDGGFWPDENPSADSQPTVHVDAFSKPEILHSRSTAMHNPLPSTNGRPTAHVDAFSKPDTQHSRSTAIHTPLPSETPPEPATAFVPASAEPDQTLTQETASAAATHAQAIETAPMQKAPGQAASAPRHDIPVGGTTKASTGHDDTTSPRPVAPRPVRIVTIADPSLAQPAPASPHSTDTLAHRRDSLSRPAEAAPAIPPAAPADAAPVTASKLPETGNTETVRRVDNPIREREVHVHDRVLERVLQATKTESPPRTAMGPSNAPADWQAKVMRDETMRRLLAPETPAVPTLSIDRIEVTVEAAPARPPAPVAQAAPAATASRSAAPARAYSNPWSSYFARRD